MLDIAYNKFIRMAKFHSINIIYQFDVYLLINKTCLTCSCECATLLEKARILVRLASLNSMSLNSLDGTNGSSGKINHIPLPSPPAATLLVK